MAWIRISPFGRDEDVAKFMISIVANEAAAEGIPLMDEERKSLREEQPKVTPEFDRRMRRLVGRIFKREEESGESKNPRSFSGAIEWAGDQEYPYVVQICESEASRIFPFQPLRGWQRAKDLFLCIGCGLLVVLVMLAVVGILGITGVLK